MYIVILSFQILMELYSQLGENNAREILTACLSLFFLSGGMRHADIKTPLAMDLLCIVVHLTT